MENSQYRMPDKMVGNQRLVINKVKQKSQDTYQCVADNGVDTKKILFYLKVKNKKRDGVPTFGQQRNKLDTAIQDSRTGFGTSRILIVRKSLDVKNMDPGDIGSAPKTLASGVTLGMVKIGNTLGTSYGPGDSASVRNSPTSIGHLGRILQRSLSGRGSSSTVQETSGGKRKSESTPRATLGAQDSSAVSPVTEDMATSSGTNSIDTSPTSAAHKGNNPSSQTISTNVGGPGTPVVSTVSIDAGTMSLASTDPGNVGSTSVVSTDPGDGVTSSVVSTDPGDGATSSAISTDLGDAGSTSVVLTNPGDAVTTSVVSIDPGDASTTSVVSTDPGDAGTTSVVSTDKQDIDTTIQTRTTAGNHVSTLTDIGTTPGKWTDKGNPATSPEGVSTVKTDVITTMKISTGTGDTTAIPVVSTDAGSIVDSTQSSTQTVDVETKRRTPTTKQKPKSTAKPVLPTTAPVFPVKTHRKKVKPKATSKKSSQHAYRMTKIFSTENHKTSTPKVTPIVVKTNILNTEKTTVIPNKSTKAAFLVWRHTLIKFQGSKLDHRARSARVRVLCLLLALVCTMLVVLILAAVLWYRKVRTELIFDDEALNRVSRKAVHGKIEQKQRRRRVNKSRRKKPRDKKKTNEEIKELNRKGRENRKVIGKHASENRRSSLADEIAYAKSVILKSKDEKEKDYVNSVTRKIIKDSSKDRRQSFEKDLLFAKNVIVA